MIKRLTLSISCILVIAATLPLSAQTSDTPFNSANWPGQGKEFKEAKKAFRNGSRELSREDPDYFAALQQLLVAQRFNPEYSVLNREVGICYLGLNIPDSAKKYLNHSLVLDPEQGADVHIQMARAYHQAMEYDLAIRKYNDYLNMLSTKELRNDSSRINRFIREAAYAKSLEGSRARAFIDPMPPPLNTRWDEFLPLSSKSDSLLIFTSNRLIEGKKKKKEQSSVEQIYLATTGPNGFFNVESAPRKMQKAEYHTSAIYLEPSGKLMYVRTGNKPDELVRYIMKKDKWVSDGKVEKKLGKKGLITSIAISGDTSMLAMTVSDDGSRTGTDIYIAYRKNKNWSKPEPAGEMLNTPFDELGVSFHPTEKKLYFSSRGHNSIGGFDLFVSEWSDSGWSEPQNLGYPINTPFDEIFLSFTGEGRMAYYASDRSGGQGGFDLYKVSFLGAEKELVTLRKEPERILPEKADPSKLAAGPAIVEPDESVLQKVIISLGPDSLRGLKADIIVSDQPKRTSMKIRNGASAITMELPVGREYTVFINSNEAYSPPIYFDLRDSVSSDTLRRACDLVRIESGKPISLTTIRFFPDSALMLPESETSAIWLEYFLHTHSQYQFEISSHVEKSADAGHAIELTTLRATGLSAWLLEHGLPAGQVTSTGYGFDKAPPKGLPTERIELKSVGSTE